MAGRRFPPHSLFHQICFDPAGNLFIVERDAHVVRRVDARTRMVSTVAGTGVAGFSGDGGPASKAQFRQPHSIAFDAAGNLLVCDIGNQRVRLVDMKSGNISTFAGTGDKGTTPDEAPLEGTPLNGPRSIDTDRCRHPDLVLREGNAVFRILIRGRGGWRGLPAPAVPVSPATAARRSPRRSTGRKGSPTRSGPACPERSRRVAVHRRYREPRDPPGRSPVADRFDGRRHRPARQRARRRPDEVCTRAAARRRAAPRRAVLAIARTIASESSNDPRQMVTRSRGGCAAGRASAPTRQIEVIETAGIRRTEYPVTARVELPRGALRDASNARLKLTEDVIAQFAAETAWDDGSVRALSVDFNVSLGPAERRRYTLEFGPDVKSAAPAGRGLSVTEEADGIRSAASGSAGADRPSSSGPPM